MSYHQKSSRDREAEQAERDRIKELLKQQEAMQSYRRVHQDSYSHNHNSEENQFNLRDWWDGLSDGAQMKILGIFIVLFGILQFSITKYYIFGAIFLINIPFQILKTYTLPALFYTVTHNSEIISLFLSLIEGIVAGVLIAILKIKVNAFFKFKTVLITEIVSFKLLKKDRTIFTTMLLSIIISVSLSFISSSAANLSVVNIFTMNSESVLSDAVTSGLPIANMLPGGSSEGGNSIFYLHLLGIQCNPGSFSLFWFLIILLTFLLTGIVVGALTGTLTAALFAMIQNAIKGSTIKITISIITDEDSTKKINGAIEGAILGGIAGSIQAILSAIFFF